MNVVCDHLVGIDATLKVIDGKVRFLFIGTDVSDYVDGLEEVQREACEMNDGEVLEVEVEAECEGFFNRGTKDYYSGGQWYPGDKPWVDGVKVMLGEFDITRYILRHYLEAIEEKLTEIGLDES